MSNDQSSVIIVSPITGGPAEAVGIKGGDKIIKVDGESIIGLSLNEAITLIRGPEGIWNSRRRIYKAFFNYS